MNIKTACTKTEAAYNIGFPAEINIVIVTICLMESTELLFVGV